MKAVFSKSLSNLLKENGGRAAVRQAVRLVVSNGGSRTVQVPVQDATGQAKRITVKIVPVRG